MAWQTPKIDWSAADGVRDADLNRIEANILELYKGESVKAQQTIYVATTGNDTNGSGTSASPYATIAKALSMIPKNLNGNSINIHLAAGTYSEAVTIKGYHGGTLSLISVSSSTTVTVTSLTIDNSVVAISQIGLRASAAVGFIVTNNGLLFTTGNLVATGTSTGLNVNTGGAAYIGGTLTSSGTSIVMAGNLGRAYIGTPSGGGVLTATAGGIIAYGNGAQQTFTSNGGRVFTGSQTGSGNVLANAEVL